MQRIDLNSDLGESFGAYGMGDDAAILQSASSANIACGFHAGDPHGIRATCRAAVAAGVVIGAHPAYRDLQGFGRRFIDVAPAELTDDVIYQIGALQGIAASVGGSVQYVKPHGALYNTIGKHEAQARAVVQAIVELNGSLPLMVLPGTVIEKFARDAGLRTVVEAFADRAYNEDGSLVARSQSGAVLGEDAAVEQVLRIVSDGEIVTVTGARIALAAESICIHGDSPGAVAMAAGIRKRLESDGVEIASFV
ncbi:LamB/YcsF family protein [Smaragdicoccus niigatensis]|uniref:LamB/YcsF family protein n=1 Tax=Smaragdicoccus niigatensis TaxID=359359 RepID=UPI0003802A8D|nr:5-oxoprolinase subunit PxpA [Smaragdicoccus niigatensis]